KPQLKSPEQWTLIGTELPKLDSAGKSRGTTKFTLDHYPDEVVTAVLARPPAFGAKPKAVDDKRAKAVPGVVQIATLPMGVAVIANNTYAALKARDALAVEWDTSGAETRSSDAMFADYKKAAATKGTEAAAKGNVDTAFVAGNKLHEAEYLFPFLA